MGGIGGVSLGTLSIAIEATVDEATRALQDFDAETGRIVENQKSKWSSLGDIGSSLTSVGVGLSAAITAPLLGVSAAAVTVAEDLNRARISFTTMLGSAEAANKMLADLQQFAAKTPFEFPDLVEAARRMQAMGVAAADVLPWLTSIGDAAAALGGGKETINGITLALAQMTAKGKVSAQEMNQLAERGVPAWEMLARQIGVSVPEAMDMAEKGAIKAAQAVPAILDGMNQKFGGSMDQMSRTLTGQWSNFKDQITLALIPIGQALIPALQSLLQILTPVLAALADGAKWFSELPSPIQSVAIAIGAFAAALGPALLAAGSMITSVAALAPALAALGPILGVIAIGVAAMVAAWALWQIEPIQTAVMSLWTALQSLGSAVAAVWEAMKPLQPMLAEVGGGLLQILGVLVAAGLIANLKILESVATAIGFVFREIVAPAVAFVTEKLAAMFDQISKVTGLGAAFDWLKQKTEGWLSSTKDADKGAAALKATITETKKPASELSAGFGKLTSDLDKMKQKLIEAQQKADLKKRAMAELGIETGKTQKKTVDYIAELDDLNLKMILAGRSTSQIAQVEMPQLLTELNNAIRDTTNFEVELDKLNAKLATMGGKVSSIAQVEMPQLLTQLNAAIATTAGVDSAFKTLGITSSTEFARVAEEAAKARDVVRGSDQASDFDKQTAVYKALKAQVEAAQHAGVEVPKEQLKTLDEMKRQLEGKLPEQEGIWKNFGNSVSTVITNFAQDISKSLWEGDMSWGEKGKALLKSLGQAVTSSFIEPATKAIDKFIKETIADLLGGKGFGGVKDRIDDIWGGDKDGGGAKPDVPGAPGGGGAGAAAGGLTGWISAISGIATAISSIVGNFQMMAMNKSLDLIEHEVRYSQIHLGYILEKLNEYIPGIKDIHDYLYDHQIKAFGELIFEAQHASLVLDRLFYHGEQANEARYGQLEQMIAGIERIALGTERQVTMNLNGTDPEIVAARIAQQLRLQGASG